MINLGHGMAVKCRGPGVKVGCDSPYITACVVYQPDLLESPGNILTHGKPDSDFQESRTVV